MNQTRIITGQIGSGLSLPVSRRWFDIKSLLILTILITPGAVFAQGSFIPPQINHSENSQWSPPDPRQSRVIHASGDQFQVTPPNGITFPKTAIAFDPGVRTANLDVPVSSGIDGANSVDSTIDSTATIISNLKDATSEQLSGMAATMKTNGGWTEKARSLVGSTDIGRMLGSLALVLGIYFAFVWLMRKINPGGSAGLPPEVIEVMGQVPFGPKRSLQLVRLGSKLLLLMNSPEGIQSIGEITDPNEVEYLASLCPGKRRKNNGAIAAIRNAANQVTAPTPAQPSPTQTPATSPAPAANTNSNLAQILRTLDQASRQNTAVFEA